MTNQQAGKLIQQVRKEAAGKVLVKPGRTNGQFCVHINSLEPSDASRSSFTIYSAAEWEAHPLRRRRAAPVPMPEVKVTHVQA